ncbi:MAG: LuxR C-terminal-related transcriptional regulator [Actinomycetota bacterium]
MATTTLIVGPGGCGKSHRLDEVARAHDGPVERVRGSLVEQDTEFGALRGLIGPTPVGSDAAPPDHHAAADRLVESAGADALIVVDDLHLLDPRSLAAVAALVGRRDGPSVALAARPSQRTEVAVCLDSVGRTATVERVGPLDESSLAALLAAHSGRAVGTELATDLHRATGGVARWAVPLHDRLDERGVVAAAESVLVDPVSAEVRRTDDAAGAIAELIALAPELPDDVWARACDLDVSAVRRALDSLAIGGIVDGATGIMYPAVSAALRAGTTRPRRRELHERLAAAVVDRGGEIVDAATHLLSAGSTGPDAAVIFERAGDELRFRDPTAALDWYDEAAAAGGLGAAGEVGRAEAQVAGGGPPGSLGPSTVVGDERPRLVAVRAVDEARELRTARAADLFDAITAENDASHPGWSRSAIVRTVQVLRSAAFPSVDVSGAEAGAGAVTAVAVDPLDAVADLADRLTTACDSHAADPQASGARFAHAAEALERLEAPLVVPDSPHAVGALHLTSVGDTSGAALLLDRATRTDAGGPVLRTRHALLAAWVELRRGRYERAVAVLRSPPEVHVARDRLVLASIGAGIARRNGDIARLRDAWSTAEPLLLAGSGDLFHLEVLGELLLAAERLGHRERSEPVRRALAEGTADRSHAWHVPDRWLSVQLAVEADDADAVGRAAGGLRDAVERRRHHDALVAAADAWTVVIEGDPAALDADRIEAAAQGLADRDLPWEASRLVGQAAIRVDDAAVARRLLERARQLHRSVDDGDDAAVADAGLSEREVEIARLVVDGLTHKEIGSQLYISPKTVEHHVARIRRKVQATTRAEMLATLRHLLPTAAAVGE